MKQLPIVLAFCVSTVLQGRASADESISPSVATELSTKAVEMAHEMADAMAADPDVVPPEVAGFAAMMAAAVEAASLESGGIAGVGAERDGTRATLCPTTERSYSPSAQDSVGKCDTTQ